MRTLRCEPAGCDTFFTVFRTRVSVATADTFSESRKKVERLETPGNDGRLVVNLVPMVLEKKDSQ